MKHEIHKRRNFKTARYMVLTALAIPLLCLAGLTLFAWGQALHLTETAPAAPDITLPELLTLPIQREEGQGDTILWDESVRLTLQRGSETVELTLGEYLWGVVAAEMPAAFDQQALNAQACAARTYTLYKLLHPTAAHEADLCDDTGCCQAYLSRQERRELWGSDRDALEEKINTAVRTTDAMAVCWQEAPIQAVFHACSDGVTRTAGEVWGSEVPYLQSVASPEGEEVPNYDSTLTVSHSHFKELLPQCDLSGHWSSWIGETENSPSGLSQSVTIGGVAVSTARLRALFGLRSASMTLSVTETAVTFHVTGYGHGVGMSQYGANALAKQGFSWQDILTWYYSGCSVENVADKPANPE